MFNMMLYSNDPLNNSICQQQPLHRLMHSKGCSLILSASLLGVGITITVMSLRSFSSTNKIFLVGPILMTVGILGMSRFLMQYLKKANVQRRRRNQVRSSNSSQNRQIHQRCNEGMEPRIDAMQTLHIPTLCHGIAQREDSESAIYLGPTDSDEGTYSDDPPPYDSVAVNTGTVVTSRVQLDNSISSSLPSLPPYDEGLVNPALDMSAETFPAPPPYEMVAVQPPSYSTGTDIIERPVRAMRQGVHGTKRKTLDPTRRTVHEVARRLVQSMQAEQAQRYYGGQALQERNETDEEVSVETQQRSLSLNGTEEESSGREDAEHTEDVVVLQNSDDRTEHTESDTRPGTSVAIAEESEVSCSLSRAVSGLSSEHRNSLHRYDTMEACSGDTAQIEVMTQKSCLNSCSELTGSENHLQHSMADISPVLLDGHRYGNARPSRELLVVTVPSSDGESSANSSQTQQASCSPADNVQTEMETVQLESCAESRDNTFDSFCTTSSTTAMFNDQTITLQTQYKQVFD